MDFRSLEVGAKPAETQADAVHEFTPIDPASIETDEDGKPKDGTGKPFLNGSDKPLVIRLADPTSPRAQREMIKLRAKWPKAHSDAKPGASEADLDKIADDTIGWDREIVARFVIGWNLAKDGDPVEFAVAHTVEFFEVFPSIWAATVSEINRLRIASGNVASGSAGGPHKTDGSEESTTKPVGAGAKS